MKKLMATLVAALMVLPVFAACGPKEGKKTDEKLNSTYRVAMITDYGTIDDKSFNQATYEACKAYCEENSVDFTYFKPADDSTAARVNKVEEAIDQGFNIVVMPGFAFGGTIHEVQDNEDYKDVKFIALDVSQFDLEDSFYNHNEKNERTNLIDENNKPHIAKNVYCAVYREEICGYMAGYAAVKLGYKHLGFLGGIAVPAVMRYGYGFVQGCDAAAKEMQIENEVQVEYVYGNKFSGDPAITARMDTWYQSMNVEVVFACGGGIYTSAVEAANKVGGKIIGVDTDQAAIIDQESTKTGMAITSAMKGLGATVKMVLETTIKEGWSDFAGKYDNLGLVSGQYPERNYVQLPLESTQWKDGAFTKDDYKALVNKIFNKEIVVSDDISAMPETSIKVTNYGNIL